MLRETLGSLFIFIIIINLIQCIRLFICTKVHIHYQFKSILEEEYFFRTWCTPPTYFTENPELSDPEI